MSLVHKVVLWVIQRRGYIVVDSVEFKEWEKMTSSPNQNGGFKKCCFPRSRRDFQEIRKACNKRLVFARKKNEKEMTWKVFEYQSWKTTQRNKQEPLNKNERHSKDWNWKYWINRIFFLVAQVLRSITEKEMLNSASFLFSFSSIRVKLLSDFRYTNNKLKM